MSLLYQGKKFEKCGTCSTHRLTIVSYNTVLRKRKGPLEELGLDGKIILIFISNKYCTKESMATDIGHRTDCIGGLF
jgi:hypothetical protein